MHKSIHRSVAGLAAAAAAVAVALTGSPAHAAQGEAGTGLTFFQGTFSVPVLHLAAPDGRCGSFPPAADSLAASGTVSQVVAYRTADCTSVAVGLGTLRTFRAGEFLSFRAS